MFLPRSEQKQDVAAKNGGFWQPIVVPYRWFPLHAVRLGAIVVCVIAPSADIRWPFCVRASIPASSKRVVRLGFIIGLIALIGVLLSGLAAYRVHQQDLMIDSIAVARAIDVHASLVQDRLTERELLARVASGLFRSPSLIKANMLEPLRSSIYAFKTDFVIAGWVARLRPDELDAAQKELASAGFPNPTIRNFDDKPLDRRTIT